MAESAKEIKESQREAIVSTGSGAKFYFDVRNLSDSAINYIFPPGEPDTVHYIGIRCQPGEDRIIQKYLEQQNYQVDVQTRPLFLPLDRSSVVRVDTISFLGPKFREEGQRSLLTPPSAAYVEDVDEIVHRQGFDGLGYVNIDTRVIHKHVLTALKAAGIFEDEEPLVSIAETSQFIWSRVSRNMKGAIHNWMLTKQRVFKPHHYVTKPSKSGCRLSIADQVTVGILYGLFSFGVKYSAFAGPVLIYK